MNNQNTHFDVVVVGAGLSGIGAACHLRKHCSNKTFVLLEGRKTIGGTWDLFRYPGVRSDSDMHTLGYNFKPWEEAKAIADGPSILNYIHETADEYNIKSHIRFSHKVLSADWNSKEALWFIKVHQTEQSDEQVSFTCNMLLMCGGYYSYKSGYQPEFKGMSDFKGKTVHPQQWPANLDYQDKNVAVIGSGATAVTLIPAMANSGAKEITMVQRSPTYVVSRPDTDSIANTLRKYLPARLAYAITRWKNINMQRYFYNQTRINPEKIKGQLLSLVRKELPKDYVEQHFTPKYNPWDERLCLIPNADLFKAIREAKARVATGHINCFTADGLQMESGEKIKADIIVTATGLNLEVLAGVTFSVDGESVQLSDACTYKGMMYADIPNMVHIFGYVNASWTLRADLTAEYCCRLINHMDKSGMRQCMPVLRDFERDMERRSWIDAFSPGYMKRTMHLFPKQGAHAPWVHTQNYRQDKKMIHKAPLEDGVLLFTNPAPGKPASTAADMATIAAG